MKIDVTTLYGRRAINRWKRISVGDVLERVTWSFPEKEALVGEKATEKELISFCRGKLAFYEIPKAIIFIESLSKTVGGKI
ncbi:MAG: hypothetical protein ACP5KH_07385 [Thermodesulfovibrio sp.]|uniref:Uncharacterized protein n=1 Tax=Thermodesulfovibrio obliviosus TaxID=3118332 RepID=A0AAU8H227_9BACT